MGQEELGEDIDLLPWVIVLVAFVEILVSVDPPMETEFQKIHYFLVLLFEKVLS
jgi:hypothetical protein